jgi:murein DD-endopeptidase MepM/ murein hydrolase activator NlpD
MLVPTRGVNAAIVTPTPDRPHSIPTAHQEPSTYTVRAGDTYGSIAQAFGLSVDALRQTNGAGDADFLQVGTTLAIPAPIPGAPGPGFKVIPDSELAYAPASAPFDVAAFIRSAGGFLGSYTQDIGGSTYTAAQIVTIIAQNYSVNPRLLLALLEHRSHWVTVLEPASVPLDYPLGFIQSNRPGLYHQLAWAANEFNRGYYAWRARAASAWVLHDGTIVPIDPTINAGTAGVQGLFSVLDGRSDWGNDVGRFGFFQTYFFLFGNPFDQSIEPLLPAGITQPHLELPFEPRVVWAFTGGPHAAWDSGSAWGGLDFAPPDVSGCAVSQEWITAAADGFIVRAGDGAVIEDFDGDGYEQTGWNILYMHVAAQDRVQAGTYVYAGDHIGHASCEGGIANAAHLHIARKYNGEWIAADGSLPFSVGGWTSAGDGVEYDGFLKRGAAVLEAAEGASELNNIKR